VSIEQLKLFTEPLLPPFVLSLRSEHKPVLVEFALSEHMDVSARAVAYALAMVVLPEHIERADVFDGWLVEKVIE
jgi:hypothetical protein